MARAGATAVLGVALLAAGCSTPVLPKTVSFRGATLTGAGDWSRGGVTGGVWVPAGQVMPTAALQVGIIHSRDHATGQALSAWALERFGESRLVGSHVSRTADEACKTGVADLGANGVRAFIAIHVCRTGQGAAACAEVDEKVSSDDVACLVDGGCAQRLCDGRWLAVRTDLEPLLARVLAAR